MPLSVVPLMRISLWLLLAAATLIALFWLMLVVASGFTIWTAESNAAGVTLQTGLLLSPVALFLGVKLSTHSVAFTIVLFAFSWFVALAALIILRLL